MKSDQQKFPDGYNSNRWGHNMSPNPNPKLLLASCQGDGLPAQGLPWTSFVPARGRSPSCPALGVGREGPSGVWDPQGRCRKSGNPVLCRAPNSGCLPSIPQPAWGFVCPFTSCSQGPERWATLPSHSTAGRSPGMQAGLSPGGTVGTLGVNQLPQACSHGGASWAGDRAPKVEATVPAVPG